MPRTHRWNPAPSRQGAPTLAVTLAVLLVVSIATLAPAAADGFGRSYLSSFTGVTPIGSTVPANGDLNPYGIATVDLSAGALVRGDTLISNFNDGGNEQGTGTTIVEVSPTGEQSLFARITPSSLPAQCPGGVGLTTALAILPGGYVVVGSLPTSNGQAATAEAGCLIILDRWGHPIRTIAGGPINGPWDLGAVSYGPFTSLFVTNVLNGTVEHGETPTDGGTVVRIDLLSLVGRAPVVISERVIADGFPERTDPAALVLGPTGVALDGWGTLYVADTQDNRIAAVPDALFRQGAQGAGGLTVARGGLLDAPLGLTLAPNGDILTANGNDGSIVETTPWGSELGAFETGAGAGGLFGLVLAPGGRGLEFVNDTENTLELAH